MRIKKALGAQCEPRVADASNEAMKWPKGLLLAVGAGGTAGAVDQALDLGQCHRELVKVVASQIVAILDEDLVADPLDRQRIDLGAIVLAVAALPALAIGDDLVTRHRDLVAVDGHRKGLRRDGQLRATGAGLLLHGYLQRLQLMLQEPNTGLVKQRSTIWADKGKVYSNSPPPSRVVIHIRD